MRDLQREILSQVAAGAISAEEGAARLAAMESVNAAPVQAPTAQSKPQPTPSGREVRIVSQFGAAEVIADPTVAFAIAEGPHQARQDGDTMTIEHEPFEVPESFIFGGDQGAGWRGRKLTVRMHPDLALVASVQAGNLRIEGVRGPIRAEVQAGNCTIADFHGPLDLSVQAGNVVASGRLDTGSSRVRCEMGAVKIGIDKRSSVRISARTTMGKLSIDPEGAQTFAKTGAREVTIGSGAATLDIDCAMGNIKVFTE
ncbi:MAG TPA: DUF4097 family beta strand repeat-containing protein [Candidatus Acidoferrum sp.]|nr:DUF4097 family beta strand repeat-containing protein [Candidatus Acidoferrum sp.]